MQTEIKIDEDQKEPKVIIITNKITEEINLLVQKISAHKTSVISGLRNDSWEILEPSDIVRIFSGNQKVFVVTKNGEYTTKIRLYEFEDILDNRRFIRISNTEILNLKMVKNFDLSFSGTICVTLLDGTSSYVSRRYVSKIKQSLGI